MFLMEKLDKYIWFWWFEVRLTENVIKILIGICVIVKSATISKCLLFLIYLLSGRLWN